MVLRLEVCVDYFMAATDCPFDNLHAAEAAGPVALFAALELVERGVGAAAERIGAEVWEVVPLLEGLDVVFTEWRSRLGCVARVLVQGRHALDE